MNWYVQVLTKYAKFNGKARQIEYWYFVLFHVLISLIIYFVDADIGVFGARGIIIH